MLSSSASSGVELLLTVIKEFVNEDRSSLELTLVRHLDFDCIEIIGFDPSTSQETNRIYVSLKKIRSKLSRKLVDEETSKIDSESLAPKTQSQKLNKAMTDLTIEYLLARIQYQANDQQPDLVLFMSNDISESNVVSTSKIPAFQYEVKPDGIVPHKLVQLNQQSAKLGTIECASPTLR